MERFEASVERSAVAIGVVGAIMTYVFGASQYLSIAATLAGLAAVGAAFAMYFLYSLQDDIERRINGLESKLDTAFEELLRETEGAEEDSYPTLADGSGWRSVPGLQVDKEEISGVPSIAGAAAGGAMGVLFGPQAGVVGAALGAILGGGKEYSDLKSSHQERLEETARTAVSRVGSVPSSNLTLEGVEDADTGDEGFWVFTFGEQTIERTHKIRISKEDGRVEYQPHSTQRFF